MSFLVRCKMNTNLSHLYPGHYIKFSFVFCSFKFDRDLRSSLNVSKCLSNDYPFPTKREIHLSHVIKDKRNTILLRRNELP